MAWSSATPRNSTVINSSTITITSTTAGDLGVVVMAVNATTAVTVTPPSGWSTISATLPVVNNNDCQLFGFYQPNMPSGVTSLGFSTTGTISKIGSAYAAWGGGSAGTVPDGLATATGTGTPLPSVISLSFGQATELVIWGGGQVGGTSPGNPTGTGTWTAIQSKAYSGLIAIALSAILGPAAGSTQTASGSTGAAAGDDATLIVGFTATALSTFVPSRRYGMSQAVVRSAFYRHRQPTQGPYVGEGPGRPACPLGR